MKVLYHEGKTSVVLDETTGNISVIQDGLWASFVNGSLVVKAEGYQEGEIRFKKKTETLGELDGGLKAFMHVGPWDWIPCEFVPKEV